MKKKLTAEELCRTHPGVFLRRREVILAICQSGASRGDADPIEVGKWIVTVANTIVEETEQ